jgi:hypothetical protein
MARYGNKRRPSSIHCPACKGIAATRKGSACRFCGVKLYYVGEIVVDDGERAFVWLDDGWRPVVDGKGTSNGKGRQDQTGAD